MDADELVEYQQNEIDEALDGITERQIHISGPWDSGFLDGEKLQERQNDRLEAYLEGYVDALVFAEEQVEDIDNMARYAPEVTDGDDDE